MSNKEYVAFIATNVAIKESISKSILEVYAKEAITEKLDKPHGPKLGHAILGKFFKDVAPKLNSLQAVESALNKLYTDNNIEFTDKVISQVIKSYKDKVKLTEEELTEIILSSKEKQEKDKLVIAIKKSLKQNRQRYKDQETANLQTLASVLVKT